jgi:thioredoxin reductase (NADPH)
VYIVYRGKALRADYTLVERVKAKDNIEVICESVPLEAKGESCVEKLITDKGELCVSGIFVAAGLEPSTALYKDSLELDEGGYIKVSHGLKTNVKGVYAVGDCRVKQLRQLITAAADGAIAANEVIRFLEEA